MCDLTPTNDQPMNQSERTCSLRSYICLALAFSLLACADVGYAASVSLTWDANTEQDLAGYKVYQRILPSTEYGSPVFSGWPSNPSAPQTTITNLAEGSSYGFITTAFDSAGNESSPSTEETITIGGSTNVWQNAENGSVAGWLMNGLNAPTTTGVLAGAVSADWVIKGVGDLDDNGTADMVWRHSN